MASIGTGRVCQAVCSNFLLHTGCAAAAARARAQPSRRRVAVRCHSLRTAGRARAKPSAQWRSAGAARSFRKQPLSTTRRRARARRRPDAAQRSRRAHHPRLAAGQPRLARKRTWRARFWRRRGELCAARERSSTASRSAARRRPRLQHTPQHSRLTGALATTRVAPHIPRAVAPVSAAASDPEQASRHRRRRSLAR